MRQCHYICAPRYLYNTVNYLPFSSSRHSIACLCCEFKARPTFYLDHCSAVFHIILYWSMVQRPLIVLYFFNIFASLQYILGLFDPTVNITIVSVTIVDKIHNRLKRLDHRSITLKFVMPTAPTCIDNS